MSKIGCQFKGRALMKPLSEIYIAVLLGRKGWISERTLLLIV